MQRSTPLLISSKKFKNAPGGHFQRDDELIRLRTVSSEEDEESIAAGRFNPARQSPKMSRSRCTINLNRDIKSPNDPNLDRYLDRS